MNPRALVAGSARVAWRRAVTDRWLLLGLVLIVAITSFLGLTGPRLIAQASDEAARAAVTDAGRSAGLVVTVGNKIGTVAASDRDESLASKTRGRSHDIQEGLPPRVRAVTGAPTAVQLSNRLTVKRGVYGAVARLAWLSRDGEIGVTWTAGRAPQLSPLPVDPTTTETTDDDDDKQITLVEVGLTQANADVLHVSVGDHLVMSGATRGAVEAVVSGIFSPDDMTDPLWDSIPGLVDPTPVGAHGVLVPTIGMLLSDESLSDAAFALQRAALTVQYEFAADPTSLTANGVEGLRTETNALVANPTPLTLAGGVPPTVTTQLPTVLADYQARLRGAMAQASVMFVGLVTVGALALLLAARLINARRASLLSAERARGSSVAAVVVRLTLESVPVAAAGVALGALGSGAVSGSAAWVWWPGIVVAVVAAVAVPIGGARVAARSWTGERVPANRKDRERLASRRRARRTVAELAVIALAVAATAATRGRGLQQTQTQDVDLLLAATPVLLACSVTVVVLRLFPWVLRLATRLAARHRGVIPLVSMARATRTANLGLPLLALTVSLGLVVFSGLTAASTHRGEDRAALETVGADVRLDGFVAPEVLASLSSADGVTAVAEGTRRSQSTFNGDPSFKVTVLSVDAAEYGTILTQYDPDAAAELATLGSASGSDAAPRALVSPNLAGEVARHGARVFIGGATVQLDVVGTTDVALPGERLVVVDRQTLAAITPDDLEPEQVWLGGDGASAAIAAAVADRRLSGVTVLDRAVWLDNVRTSPLVRSVVSLLVVASVVLALYAAVALVLTVVATATDRGRTLSSLRTLGLDRGATWRITAAELAPLTIASVLTGAAIGVGVPLLLTESLGLNALTGERGSTSVVITTGPFLLAVGASLAALVISVLSESLVRRRENLGQILRVGER